MCKFTIKIEDVTGKEYTKKELIEEVTKQMELQMEEGVYKYEPIDPDNFYTKYMFKRKK